MIQVLCTTCGMVAQVTTSGLDDERQASTGASAPGRSRGVYGISVAAELVGTAAQNLRLYETRGLLLPERSAGGTRRYSADDLDRLSRIAALLDAGLNLAGIAMVLDLEDQNSALRTAAQQS